VTRSIQSTGTYSSGSAVPSIKMVLISMRSTGPYGSVAPETLQQGFLAHLTAVIAAACRGRR
jgi:hypothetical protein